MPVEIDDFLRLARGVIHIGANTGQERDVYEHYGLRVLWVEPIPAVFEELELNLTGYERQKALQALVTEEDFVPCQFHVSNNEGLSSSLLALKHHRDIWPEVNFIETIELPSITLPTLLHQAAIDAADYDVLVMDTQGSELRILQGALPVLPHFNYIKTEAPDFEAYAGCCQLAELDAFLSQHGFRELACEQFASRAAGGSYYDLVYQKIT